jgi:hypothetical protein
LVQLNFHFWNHQNFNILNSAFVTSSDKNLTISADELLSSPVVGSSANKNFGVLRRQLANDKRFFSPPDKPFFPLKFEC